MSMQRRLPRHDRVLLLRCGAWFCVTAGWAAVAAAPAGGPAWAIIGAALAAWSAAAGIRTYLRWRRDPILTARRDLLAALRSLPGAGPWLNHGEHAIFVYHTVRLMLVLKLVTVVQYSEDDAISILREGKAHAAAQIWRAYPHEPGVQHSFQEASFTAAGGNIGMNTEPPGLWPWLRGQRAARQAGILYATAGEVQTLAATVRDSELAE